MAANNHHHQPTHGCSIIQSISIPMAANNHHHQPTNPTPPQQNHDHPRSSGKRKMKSAAGPKKKRPQKGMSAEKVEWLPLQQRWTKMTEINPSVNLINVAHVPVKMPLNANQNRSSNPGFHHGQMGHVSFQTDLFGYLSGHCYDCHKVPNSFISYLAGLCHDCYKKRTLVNGDHNLGGGMGLDVGDNRSIIRQENQGMEVVAALHRKLGESFGPEGGNDHVLMEYEFFPPSSTIEDVDDLVIMNNTPKTSSALAGFDAAADSNKCIDLSLKLSYN